MKQKSDWAMPVTFPVGAPRSWNLDETSEQAAAVG
jgi:hypothetical protein